MHDSRKNGDVYVSRDDVCLTASFSMTTWVSQHQKVETSLDFSEEMMG